MFQRDNSINFLNRENDFRQSSKTLKTFSPVSSARFYICAVAGFKRNFLFLICFCNFEYCFVDRFQSLLTTEEKQFGFKKGISCSHAIHTARGFIDRHIHVITGSTVNLCAINLTKAFAFDKVNHHALFIKLIKRHILVQVLENIFSHFPIVSFVEWNNVWSSAFEIKFEVRQGSVSSPFLFALHLDLR